jgi:hypothetical protein
MAARLYAAALRNCRNNPAAHLRREASVRAPSIPDSNIEQSSPEVAMFPLHAFGSGGVSITELRPKKISAPRRTWPDCAPITLVCQEKMYTISCGHLSQRESGKF